MSRPTARLTAISAALFVSLFAAGTAFAANTQGSSATPMQGGGYGSGPGRTGPGMMYNWTPEQRQQHWEQMRQYGYGPGMMYNWTPQQRQQHWAQMQQYGYGPGMMGPGMMGPGWGRGPSRGGRWGGPPSVSGQQYGGPQSGSQ